MATFADRNSPMVINETRRAALERGEQVEVYHGRTIRRLGTGYHVAGAGHTIPYISVEQARQAIDRRQ
ncbi:MAG TPA: hypothetical protein VFB99_17725 [Vicinamibacterales bacterium]|nr:hypothetical protein [Vicinamibacterales bacterium]